MIFTIGFALMPYGHYIGWNVKNQETKVKEIVNYTKTIRVGALFVRPFKNQFE